MGTSYSTEQYMLHDQNTLREHITTNSFVDVWKYLGKQIVAKT